MIKIILLLGSPNDDTGELSQIAIDRNECAYNIYQSNKDIVFLCTGGFGEHFNRTDKPHAYYSKEYLIAKGAKEEDFLPFVLSSNTYEDFEKAKLEIGRLNPDLVIVVTSDFHIGRARLLYEYFIGKANVLFVPAKSTLNSNELTASIDHEEQAINRLKQSLFINRM